MFKKLVRSLFLLLTCLILVGGVQVGEVRAEGFTVEGSGLDHKGIRWVFYDSYDPEYTSWTTLNMGSTFQLVKSTLWSDDFWAEIPYSDGYGIRFSNPSSSYTVIGASIRVSLTSNTNEDRTANVSIYRINAPDWDMLSSARISSPSVLFRKGETTWITFPLSPSNLSHNGYFIDMGSSNLYPSIRTLTHSEFPTIEYHYLATPSSFTGYVQSNTSISLSWNGGQNDSDTTYEVKRGTTTIYTGKNTSFTDTGLGLNTSYTYSVRAKASNGIYTPAATTTIKTPDATPITPTVTGTGLSWHPTAGRGRVVLNWQPVTGAAGYKVWVYDGNAYQSFDVGNVTSWDSSTWKIYPTEAALDGFSNNTQSGNLFNTVKGGLDLRDNPNKLYLKTVGTSYDSNTNYAFRVSAYNAGGESPQSGAVTPTLPNRTDNIPPTGTINIGGGYASSQNATISLNFIDPQVPSHTSDKSGSGLYQMRFSNDNSTWSTWQPYASTASHTLTSGSGTKTVYVQVNDNAGNVSASVSTTVTVDTSPVSGKVKINDGALYSNSRNITLSFYDTVVGPSGLKDVIISENSNFSGATWQAYSPLKDYQLSATEGSKRVYVKFRNGAGGESSSVYADILLDTIAPTGTIKINNGATATGSISATISLTASDGGSGISGYVLSNTTTNSNDWKTYTDTVTWNLTTGDGTKKVYAWFRDNAGNVSTRYEASILLDTSKPSATIVINNNEPRTLEPDVVLSLTFGGGATQMSFSNDGISWSSWEPIKATKNWRLMMGAGVKTVFVKVRNNLGVEGDIVSNNIFLKEDQEPPRVTLTINEGNSFTTDNVLSLLINAYDDLTPIQDLKLRYSTDGINWSNRESFSFTKTIVLPLGDYGIKRVFVQVEDSTGNATIAGGQIKYVSEEELKAEKQAARNEEDTQAPIINHFSLLNGATLTNTTRPTIELDVTDNATLYNNLQVQFRLSTGGWTEPQAPNFIMTPNVNLQQGTNTLYIKVIDESGNEVGTTIRFFKN